MKKRTVAVVMAAAMTIGMMVTGVSVQAGVEDKTLIVGFDAEYPPFGYKDDNGDYVGFDLDLAQEVCDNLGWELVKKPINWDSKDMELNSGTIDCKGKNVVVQAASAALDALNNDDNKDLKDSFASLTENPDYNTAFMNIDSGAADAVAVDIGVANYQLSQRGKDKYVILDEPIQNEQYGIGFKKGNDELKDLVWAEVEKLDESGEVDKLADKYELDKSMLCISEDKEDSDSDSTEADTEENADSTEKEADSESK